MAKWLLSFYMPRREKIKKTLRSILTSQRGKNILVYIIFVFISAIFWLLLTLNNEIQQEYRIKVNIKSIPDSITLLSNIPQDLKVVVREKGSTSFRYTIGGTPELNINFNEYNDGEKLFRISSVQLKSLVTNILGNGAYMVSISPDSIYSKFTTLPPKKVPIEFDIKALPNYQYAISGKIISSNYYAYVYGDKEDLNKVHKVYTTRLEETDLKDTTKRKVKIHPIPNIKIVPNSIEITIPVEPLITKKITIPVITRGVPYGVSIVTFPSKVSISYLVPANEYKDSQNFMAEAYYQDVLDKSNKLRLYLNHQNWKYGDVSMEADSVEYLIEKVNE